MLQDFRLDINGESILLTEMNCWICLFVDAPQYDHIYVFEPTTFVIFNNRAVIDKLMQVGYPMQIRRTPLPWDEKAYDLYIEQMASELELEIDQALDEG